MAEEKTVDQSTPLKPASGQLRLNVVSGPHNGLELVISNVCELLAGRGDDANLRLDKEPLVSRRHFRLDINPPWVRLVDLGSTNGTLLNGLAVSEATLSSGDRIAIGDTCINVEIQNRTPMSPIPDELQTPGLFSASSEQVGTGDSSPSATPDYPKTVGAYEIVRVLGRGGMAIVFEAFHKESGTKVAVKLIREEVGALSKMRQMFAREATILSQLKHPHIVRSHHLGFHEERLFLVMDYLPTLDLCELIDSFAAEKKIRSACWVMQRMLETLHFAHSQGIVHRDVKPSNILAFREGRRLNVKLSDFGLAKFFQDAGLGGLTEEQSIRGTLGFMAPEQVADAKNVGPAADIYAAGACLTRFITGRLPTSQFHNLLIDRWNGINWVPDDLKKIIDQSMQYKAVDRFSTALSFANAIAPFAQKP
ncbi:MAG: FHA domain-containing serine/threonine-protein kinase [Pirellulaceae bacterium]|nr:FHA domain-containing serine/threonine-protein kinase [Pirellulaceae bacterium]